MSSSHSESYTKKGPDVCVELMKRGMSFADACLATEAVYSCAIEGARIPNTPQEFDSLYLALTENSGGKT